MWRILGVGAVVHFCRLPDFVETEIEGSGFRVGAGFDRGFLRVDGETRMMGVVGVKEGRRMMRMRRSNQPPPVRQLHSIFQQEEQEEEDEEVG